MLSFVHAARLAPSGLFGACRLTRLLRLSASYAPCSRTDAASACGLDPLLKEVRALKEIRPDMTLIVVDGITHSGSTGIQAWPGLAAAIKDFVGRHPQ